MISLNEIERDWLRRKHNRERKLSPEAKERKRLYRKEWYQNHKEEQKQRVSIWMDKNKERLKRWRARNYQILCNKEKVKLYHRKWVKKNPEKNTENCKKWRHKHREKYNKYFEFWQKNHKNQSKS